MVFLSLPGFQKGQFDGLCLQKQRAGPLLDTCFIQAIQTGFEIIAEHMLFHGFNFRLFHGTFSGDVSVSFSIRLSRQHGRPALEGGKGQRTPAEDVGMLERCLQHRYFCCSQIPKQESYTQIFQACCCHGEALDLQTDLLLVAADGDSDQVVAS